MDMKSAEKIYFLVKKLADCDHELAQVRSDLFRLKDQERRLVTEIEDVKKKIEELP